MRREWLGVLAFVCTCSCASDDTAGGGTDTETETDATTGVLGTSGTAAASTTGGPGADATTEASQSGTDDTGTTQTDSTGSAESAGSTSSSGSTDPTSSSSTSSTSSAVCGGDVDVFEDDSMAICPPQASTTYRVVECLCTYDPPLLDAATRPLDSSDLLYYVNRWYSIDPCFPFAPSASLLAEIRDTYINAVDDLEPEMLQQCGTYDVDFVQLPPAFTNDNDQLLTYAWTSPAPAGYPTTLDGETVGFDGEVGFAPMFAAAAEEGIDLFVQSGFRSMQTQADLFEFYAGVEGDPALAAVYSAWPAHSEHQLGTTADVGYIVDGQMISPFNPLEADLHASEAFVWIRSNAHRFGIVTTYQPRRVHVHQYKPEPWHLRFVGAEAADVMHTCGLSTEELLAFRYHVDPLPEFINMDLVYDAVLEGGWKPATCVE